MLKKIFQGIFVLIGLLVGYEVFELLRLLYGIIFPGRGPILSSSQVLAFDIIFALIFGIIFYKIMPVLNRKGKKAAETISADLQSVSAGDLIGGTIGLLTGLVIAFLLTQIYSGIIDSVLSLTLTIAIYLVLGYTGMVIGNKKLGELIGAILANRRQGTRQTVEDGSHASYNLSSKDRKKGAVPKILDTSVIIDGRIVEILKTGFLEGPIVIPEFVLVELRHIADSSDSLKRNRGRRGLDILNRIQEDYGIDIYNTDSEKALKDIPEVDVKLLKLAQIMKGKVVTNDFNLNKVSVIKGVPVLNINELANAMKPMVIPGEVMTVTLIRQGKEAGQAVAYLDDGTMIVVEDGRKRIGKTVEINVTSVLQTAAGRMIFGKMRDSAAQSTQGRHIAGSPDVRTGTSAKG